MAILLDTAAVHRLIEARLESAVDGAGSGAIQVLHMGESLPENPAVIYVRVLGLEVQRRQRRSTDEADSASITVAIEVACPEALTVQSQLSLASAVAAVVAGLDHWTTTEGGPPAVTEIHLGPVSEALVADAPGGIHRLLGADISVSGLAIRRSGSTLEAHP